MKKKKKIKEPIHISYITNNIETEISRKIPNIIPIFSPLPSAFLFIEMGTENERIIHG